MSKSSQGVVLRGEVYKVNLTDDPEFNIDGQMMQELNGVRPVLVIQNDVGNVNGSTIVIAGITTTVKKRKYPMHVSIKAGQGVLKDSTITLDHIRTIDKRRLIQKMGKISPKKMREVDKALFFSFFHEPEFISLE